MLESSRYVESLTCITVFLVLVILLLVTVLMWTAALYMLFVHFDIFLVLLQRGADPSIRNTDGKTALDLADPLSKSVLTGTENSIDL